MASLDAYQDIVTAEVIARIYEKARKLHKKHILHINSTSMGGGVAEILGSLVPLMNDIGIDTGWRILHGSPDFFTVTKKFHNALQGGNINLSENKKRLYFNVNEMFSKFTHIGHDCVILHDPQPLALVKYYKKRQPWVWRCHIDLSDPHEGLWSMLTRLVLRCDVVIVSSEKYKKPDLPVTQKIIYPAIDPLSLKNMDMTEKDIARNIKRAGIPTDKPIITQVSRMDPWKNPEGLLDIFQRVREHVDCRLVFCYNLATDDPESMEVYSRVYRKARKLVDSGDVVFVMGNNDVLVNCIQRFSTIIAQCSTKEGFCLTVTEALWKGKPVVASNAGGIPVQIEDGVNGFLLDPKDLDGFADRFVRILKDPKLGDELGRKGREIVREDFLITRQLSDYLNLLNELDI